MGTKYSFISQYLALIQSSVISLVTIKATKCRMLAPPSGDTRKYTLHMPAQNHQTQMGKILIHSRCVLETNVVF